MAVPICPENLAPNPGFEEVADDRPAAWVLHAARPEIAPVLSSAAGVAHSGTRSLLLSGGGKPGAVGWVLGRCGAVEPGGYYQATAHVRCENLPGAYEYAWAMVRWSRKDGAKMQRAAYLDKVENDGDWYRLSGLIPAPDDAAAADLMLGAVLGPEGRVWWDDVSLRPTDPPTPRRARIATAYIPYQQRTPEHWRAAVVQAGEGKADIVCLGELAEILPPDPEARHPIPGPETDVLAELARRYHMMIVVSLREWVGSVRYNTAALIGRDGTILGKYRKTYLPLGELLGGTEPGLTFPVFETDIGRVGMQICYDHMFPEVSRLLALNGAEIVFTPVMGDGRANQAYDAVGRARAIDNTVFYVTSMRDVPNSQVISPTGRVLADTQGTPGVAFADIDLNERLYQPYMSIGGEGDFANIWRRERHPSVNQALAEAYEVTCARQAPAAG
jgi:predicted amidohydrolase